MIDDRNHLDQRSVPERIFDWSKAMPNKSAYVFVENGEEISRVSYAQLDTKARDLAARLRSLSVDQSRALILCPDSQAFAVAFFGCLYARVIAVPSYPPEPFRLQASMDRLEAIATDAEPTVVIATREVETLWGQLECPIDSISKLPWVVVDSVLEDEASSDRAIAEPVGGRGDDLALLQYTSGSTGAPKGVMVSYDNLLANERAISSAFQHDQDVVVVGWLPLFHDMGLIGNLLNPAFAGGTSILMSPLDFIRRPATWLSAISKYRAATSGGPNFAYALCSRRVDPEKHESLDLSTWRVAFNGAEPILPATMREFSARFERWGFDSSSFYPCYGLAESTLIVSGGNPKEAAVVREFDAEALGEGRAVVSSDGRSLAGCGSSVDGSDIEIWRAGSDEKCEEGEVGEVCVTGESVAMGYWANPELSERVFAEAASTIAPTGRRLRTGDLGFIEDGNLFVCGRLKDLIIVRGVNHHPQDIEQVVGSCHEDCRAGGSVAFQLPTEEDPDGVCIVQELRRDLGAEDAKAVVDSARRTVVQSSGINPSRIVLAKKGCVPKTSSGKIQRRQCREMLLRDELPVRFEWSIEHFETVNRSAESRMKAAST